MDSIESFFSGTARRVQSYSLADYIIHVSRNPKYAMPPWVDPDAQENCASPIWKFLCSLSSWFIPQIDLVFHRMRGPTPGILNNTGANKRLQSASGRIRRQIETTRTASKASKS